jgi:hypothetical protein
VGDAVIALLLLACDLHGDINVGKIDLGEDDTATDTDDDYADLLPPGYEVPFAPYPLAEVGAWVETDCGPDPAQDGTIPTSFWIMTKSDIAYTSVDGFLLYSDDLWRATELSDAPCTTLECAFATLLDDNYGCVTWEWQP